MSSKEKKNKAVLYPNKKRIRLVVMGVGGVFFLVGAIVLLFIYYPVAVQEVRYFIRPGSNTAIVVGRRDPKSASLSAQVRTQIIHPVNEAFGIVIPKIGANSSVIQDVSPFNEKEYQQQLTKGVAHARDSALPGESGNTFIFAHSAASTYEANRYNAVFYLLNKLEKGDSVYVFFKEKKYRYTVTGNMLVAPDSLEYLNQDRSKQELTLMTCWPPGTTLQRLIVRAHMAESAH